jgi:hypothetical protein
MIAIREAECGNSGARERLAGRDDVRLIGMAAEAVQDGGTADRRRVRKMQDSIELGVLDADSDALRGHQSVLRTTAKRSNCCRTAKPAFKYISGGPVWLWADHGIWSACGPDGGAVTGVSLGDHQV